MMENLGAYNLIEACPQFIFLFDGKQVDLEIVKVVLSLGLLSTADTGCAEVDASHLSCRLMQGILGCPRFTATSNQDGVIFPKRFGRTK